MNLSYIKDVFGYEETRGSDSQTLSLHLYLALLSGEEYELELIYNYNREEPYDLGDGYEHMAIGVDNYAC